MAANNFKHLTITDVQFLPIVKECVSGKREQAKVFSLPPAISTIRLTGEICKQRSTIEDPVASTGLIFPRHVFKRIVRDFLDVFEQPGQVLKGIDAGQLAGVDQAHEQVAHVGAAPGAVKK